MAATTEGMRAIRTGINIFACNISKVHTTPIWILYYIYEHSYMLQ